MDVDHRSVGYGTLSRDEATKLRRSFRDVADDVRFRVDDVLARWVIDTGWWSPATRTSRRYVRVAAEGRVFKTKTGELSIHATSVRDRKSVV